MMHGTTFAVAGLLAATVAARVTAGEVLVLNDSFTSGGTAVIVGDFAIGEHAGARLLSPCQGAIVAVQIGWFAGSPSQLPSLEGAFHIFDGETFPAPNAHLAEAIGPLLTPGFINEFRFLDDTKSFPINIPVLTGQQFYVTLEFGNPTNVGGGGASVFRDVNGCQTGKNTLFAFPGTWLDFCVFLSGDLVIRAIVDCAEAACEWDCADNNGSVEIVDFLTLLAMWGTIDSDCDFDGEGVGITDFLELLAHWGPCPT